MKRKDKKDERKNKQFRRNKNIYLRRLEPKCDGKSLAKINLKRNIIEGIAELLPLKALENL